MKQRRIEISTDNRSECIVLPINPSSFALDEPTLNSKITLLSVGEVNLIGNRGLAVSSISGFFPSTKSPFYRYANRSPEAYVSTLHKWRDARKPVRLIVSDLGINLMMTIDKLHTEYREGSKDIIYSIEMSKYRKLNVPELKVQVQVRPDTRSKGTHTVVKGDCLWAIAKRYYGNGSKYPTIYNANRAVIDPRNKKYHMPRYTIYPGQVLTIP